MTKELTNEIKEYAVNLSYDTGKAILKVNATVEVSIDSSDWESDVRVISVDIDEGEDTWSLFNEEIEKSIIDNWANFEEIEGGSGG